jgi:hypothetical protein
MKTLLNGRVPLDWELPIIARGYAYLLERDTTVLAGLLSAARPPAPSGYATVLLPPLGTP